LDSVSGFELWRTDGTAAGTTLVKDIYPGSSSSFPSVLTPVGGTLFFSATDPTNGRELWALDVEPRSQLETLRERLAGLEPSLTGQQAKVRLGSALQFCNNALAGTGWTADGRPKTNDDGRAALLQIRQCVQYLRTPNAELAAASAAIQSALSELVRQIAEERYAEVAAAPGASSSRLLQARTSLDQAAAAPGTIEALYDAINAWSVLKTEPPQHI
jgi:ELWxxDGT repeat protein